MRKKKVWRYYCEHCSRGGCSGGHIKKHERGCTKNPDRICGLCATVGDVQQRSMAALIDALRSGGLVALRELAEGCPACMLAAIVQDRRQRCISNPRPEEEYYRYDDFDYRAERQAWWTATNNAREGY